MYSYIKGRVIEAKDGLLILESANIGYELHTAEEFLPLFELDKESIVYTSLVVRENVFELFAFPSQAHKKYFELLQKVSGVGPKLSAAIISQIEPSDFALAVLNSDYKTLTKVKGLGKKGAQRLVIELKDKLNDSKIELREAKNEVKTNLSLMQEEFSQALLVLGYSQVIVQELVQKVYSEEISLEENIRRALHAMAKF